MKRACTGIPWVAGVWVWVLLAPLAAQGAIVNIDFNGDRNVPGPNARPVTYQGAGAAGGGGYWNGLAADSRLPDGSDDDNLTVGGTNLLDAAGVRTALSFVVSPMGGDSTALRTGQDTTNPLLPSALFSDYIFNNSAGNAAGESPFEIRGFGHATTVDLYFYRTSGGVTISGETADLFTPTGIFTTANTICFKTVPVVGGVVRGSFGSGTAVIGGMSIVCDCDIVVEPITIVSQPTNVTVLEGNPVTFQVQVGNFDPVSYQWQRNLLDVPGATQSSYTLPAVSRTNDGDQFHCIITNTLGSVTSSNAILTVLADTTPPTIRTVQNIGNTGIRVIYSEPVDPGTATNSANYHLNNGGSVLEAKLDSDPQTVFLATTLLSYGTTYLLSVSNVLDRAWQANVIAPASFAFLATEYVSELIGGAGLAGSLISETNGFVLSVTGGDIGSVSDQFLFGHRLCVGDFDIQVRVESFLLTDPWAKAGLMAREDLSTNSRLAAILTTPSIAGTFFLSRSTPGQATVAAGSCPVNYPYTWLRLERVGNVFNGYAAATEGSWTRVGSVALSLSNTIYFGMVGSSHSPAQTTTVRMRDLRNAVHEPGTAVATPREPLGPSSRRTGLVISEIMYHPAPRNDGRDLEFVELFNARSHFQDLSGFRLSGDIDYTFPPGTLLPAGGFLLVANNPADLQSVYALSGVLGPYAHRLPGDSGTLRLRDQNDAILLDVQYGSRFPWPRSADGTGHSLVLAWPSYGEGDPRAWAVSDHIGGSPGTFDGLGPDPLWNIVINEALVRTNGTQEGFVELYNHSNQDVDLAGSVLTDVPVLMKFTVPPSTMIPARGFVSFSLNSLGLVAGNLTNTIYLFNPARTRVIDALDLKTGPGDRSLGRFPDGAPMIGELSTPTPGMTNSTFFMHDIIINEIMYHPLSENGDEEYVELHNRGTNVADVSWWRLAGAVEYDIPTNTVIAGGDFLVIARNTTNLLAKYPHLSSANVVGNYDRTLSDRGEELKLLRPDWNAILPGIPIAPTNLPHMLVDAVGYNSGGRWGKWADGGGSSLELKDPRADSRFAYNWADSDESQKSTNWTTIEYTGRLDFGNTSYSADSLHILLLGEGECLVDNVEVLAASGGGNLVANGTFESGTNGWFFQGNHDRTTLETNSGYLSARSLHLRASGDGDTGGNRIRTRLTSSLAPASTATLRARVCWLRGHPEILLRLHGNWLEATGRMTVPANLGTPGAPNSQALTNAGPAISEVAHAPVLPAAQEPVLVTARVQDPDGVASVQLRWRLDPSATLTSVHMVDDGTGGDAVAGDGIYSASIPAQNENALVAFHVTAADHATAVTSFPVDAPARECLVRFGDPQPAGSFGTYRVWMTEAVRNRWSTRDKLSNDPLDVTFVYGNHRVIYNAGGLYSGSPYKARSYDSPMGTWCDYVLRIPPDDRFLGSTEVKLCYPGNLNDDATMQREQTTYWIADHLGIPHNERRYVNLFVNGVKRGAIIEDTQVPNADVIEERYPEDTEGDLYKGSLWFEFTDTDLATFVPTSATLQKFTTTGGVKKLARYRWNWQKRAVSGSVNDYTTLFALVEALNSGAAVYTAQVEGLVDVEQWMRTFAVEHIVGNWDSVGYRNGSNMYGYKPRASRWQLLIWDIDVSLRSDYGTGPTSDLFEVADPTLDRLMKHPPFRRAYWRALLDAANGPLLNARVDPLLDARYAALQANGVGAQSPAVIKTWISARREYILGQLATVAASFTAGGPATTTTNRVTLAGTAPVEVSRITVNGRTLAPVWSTVTNWSADYIVAGGTNLLTVSASDARGTVIAATNLTVAFIGTNAWPQLRINEWMADNGGFVRDPADNATDDWFELYNPTGYAADLTGWTLTDTLANPVQFVVPAGYAVPAGGYLLVWADGDPTQNSTNRPDLHVNFKLNKSGEAIGLFAPDRTLVDYVTFGAQLTDVSEGRFPDGAGAVRRLTLPTPGTANALTEMTRLLWAEGTVTLTFTTTPGLRYQVEFSEDLSGWMLLGAAQTATGSTLTVVDPGAPGSHRFYRVIIIVPSG